MKKTLLAFFMFTIMVFTGTSAYMAETYSGTCGAQGNNITWVLDDTGLLTISGSGEMIDYTYYWNVPWYSNRKSINSIIVEPGIKSIGDNSFYECSNLIDTTLPNSLSRIGNSAFCNCYNLPNIILPDSITSIGESAFNSCFSLTSIALPDNVTSIGNHAFFDCSNLTSFIVSSGNANYSSQDGVLFNKNKTLLICCPGRMNANYVIPNSVTKIDNSAFSFCRDLTSVTIPDSVTSIGDEAFLYCSSLANITIPDGVTSIDARTFYYCSSLMNITLPDSITSIGEDAFYECASLKSIKLPDNVTSVGAHAFSGCSNLTNITIPDGMTSIDARTFSGCSSLANITIPDSITNIEDYAFAGCASLKSIKLPNNVTSVGEFAFSGCTSLITITLSDNLTSIEWGMFSDCTSLKSIEIPNQVTKIESSVFWGCNSLASIMIPDSVTSIGGSVFKSCWNLKSVFIKCDKVPFKEDTFSTSPTIYCYEFTDVDYWATDNGYSVIYLDDLDFDTIRTISLQSSFRLVCGEACEITVDVFPNYDHPEIIWESSDPSTISVNSGIVVAHKPGKAIITATVGSVSAFVNVTAFNMASDFYLQDEVWVIAKTTYHLEVSNIIPEGAETDISWSSNDETIAIVDENGLVTTKKPGDAVITATDTSGLSRTTTFHVCYPVTAIEIQPVDPIHIGQTLQLIANVTMRTQSCVNHLVTFTSSDETIASVDENGLVTALSPGTVEIAATAESGISASCSIIVNGFEAVLNLPADLREINSEAFADLASVEAVRIPDTVTSISDDAFSGSNITIIAPAGSYAIQWAEDHGIQYVEE